MSTENEITSSAEIAERDWDGESEPGDVDSDFVATNEAEEKGIEFHVSMRRYTMHDMERLIIEAAATLIVGRHNDKAIAKAIEAKCIDLINEKATAALSTVTAEIIDQPVTPSFGDNKPVTMRELIGLCGREYLTETVDPEGNPRKARYGISVQPRMEYIVGKFIERKFKQEVDAATSRMISEVQRDIKARHEALLNKEKARIRDAMDIATK